MTKLFKFVGTCLFAFLSVSSLADTTVPLIIQTGPGGMYHKIALELQPELSKILNSTVVVEFKPGGQGIVGAQTLVDSKRQLSLMVGAIQPEFDINQATDIVPLLDIGVSPTVVVARNDLDVANLNDVLKLKSVTFGVANGSSQLYWVRGFKNKYNLNVIEVPYKTGTAVLPDIINGTLDLGVVSVVAAIPLVEAGKLKVLTTLSTHRSNFLPQVKTPREQGIMFDRDTIGYAHMMIWGSPAITPEQVRLIQNEFAIWVTTPESKEIFKKLDLGFTLQTLTKPEQKIRQIVIK